MNTLIVPSDDKGIAKAFFEALPIDDVNRKYYEGKLKYVSPKGFLRKMYHSLFVQPKLFEELKLFYPYQRNVVATRMEWEK